MVNHVKRGINMYINQRVVREIYEEAGIERLSRARKKYHMKTEIIFLFLQK